MFLCLPARSLIHLCLRAKGICVCERERLCECEYVGRNVWAPIDLVLCPSCGFIFIPFESNVLFFYWQLKYWSTANFDVNTRGRGHHTSDDTEVRLQEPIWRSCFVVFSVTCHSTTSFSVFVCLFFCRAFFSATHPYTLFLFIFVNL